MKMSPSSLFAPCVSTVTGGGAVGPETADPDAADPDAADPETADPDAADPEAVAAPAGAAPASEYGMTPAMTAATASASLRQRCGRLTAAGEEDGERNGVLPSRHASTQRHRESHAGEHGLSVQGQV